MNELAKAYIAGLFDGEGTVSLTLDTSNYHYYAPALQIFFTNNDKAMLVSVANDLGTGIIYQKPKQWRQNYHDTFDLKILGREKQSKFIETILPYIRSKKAELIIAKEAVDFMIKRYASTTGKHRWTEEQMTIFETYVLQMRSHRQKSFHSSRKIKTPLTHVKNL